VALGLLARGHEPIACSRQLGEVAAELRRATVPVVDDPDHVSTTATWRWRARLVSQRWLATLYRTLSGAGSKEPR